jgi:hypothetical protein
MKAGSPGSYAGWLQGGEGAGGGGGGGMPGGGQSLDYLISLMFGPRQQQQRPDYSQLFANANMNLEVPTAPRPAQPQLGANYNTFANRPGYGFGNINPYGGA